MRPTLPRWISVGIALACITVATDARQVSEPGSGQNLAAFEGLYDYHGDSTLFIVAGDDRLVAIIGDAKYPLRATGVDAFVNPGGDPIPFLRDADGRVVAFKEGDQTYRRRSAFVPPEARGNCSSRDRGAMDARSRTTMSGLPNSVMAFGPRGRTRHASREDCGAARERRHRRHLSGCPFDLDLPQGRVDAGRILLWLRPATAAPDALAHQERDLSVRGSWPSTEDCSAPTSLSLRFSATAAYANPDPRKARVTLIDLLSNQSGFACDDHDGGSPGNEVKLYETADWAKAFVDLPMVADPGTVGRYCSGGILAAGRISRARCR